MEQHGTYPSLKYHEHGAWQKQILIEVYRILSGEGFGLNIPGMTVWFSILWMELYIQPLCLPDSWSKVTDLKLFWLWRWLGFQCYIMNTEKSVRKEILPKMSNGHSLNIIDFDATETPYMGIGNGHFSIIQMQQNRILIAMERQFPKEIIISQELTCMNQNCLSWRGRRFEFGKTIRCDTPRRLDVWLQNGQVK